MTLKRKSLHPQTVTPGYPERALLALINADCRILSRRERPWASATFTGVRRYWTIIVSGPTAQQAAAQLTANLPSHEFVAHKQLVADAFVAEQRTVIEPDGTSASILCVEMLVVDAD